MLYSSGKPRELPATQISPKLLAKATRRTPPPLPPAHHRRSPNDPLSPSYFSDNQGVLFDEAAIPAATASVRKNPKLVGKIQPIKRSIQERFDSWLAAHPEIEELYVKFARDVKGRGFDKYSVAAITERIRWHYHIERDTKEPFAISNDFRSRIGRYLMGKYEDLDGFFELRTLREMTPAERAQYGEDDSG